MKSLYAALVFFTRLPFWRLYNPPAEAFKSIVNYWWFAGIITGGIMAAGYFAAAHLFPALIAAIVAVVLRLLATGALHEDGLADLCDGFGGGTTRERILAIMKDSFIGSYGVIGLIIYFLLLCSAIAALPREVAPYVILFGDIFSKALSAHIIQLLPYARREEESKAKVVYVKMSLLFLLINLVVMTASLLLLHHFVSPYMCNLGWRQVALLALVPAILFLLLIALMKRRIGGYTGDCCGALFLLCELSFYLTFTTFAL